MKLLILILPFIIYQLTTTQEVGGFTEMDLSEAKQDPNVIKNLRFGVNQIIDQEVAAGRLPDCHYTVDNIYSVYTQVVSGINYRFDVSIKNRRGWEIRATFVVYSQEWTDTTELTSYTYDVTTCPRRDAHDALLDWETHGECPRGYQRIDESELDEDPELRAAFDAGLEAAIAEAIRIHRLPDADYEVSEIHSIYSRESGSGKNYHRILQEDEINYRFDVSITNCAGLTARLVFIVNVDGNDFDTTLVCIRITTIPDEGLVGDEVCGAGEEGEIPGEQGNLPNEEV